MRIIHCLLTLSASFVTAGAIAQANILGLPAIPQSPLQSPGQAAAPAAPNAGASASAKSPKPSASAARAAASAAKPAAVAAQGGISDVADKSVLSGGVTMASSYEGKVATVRVTTNNIYQGEVYRSQAIKAAKLVQRDLAASCAWQCKPAPMPTPQILADGKLQFVMAIDNYPRVLSYDDMITMLMGTPLAVTPKPVVTPTAAAPAAKAPAVSPAPATPSTLPPGVVRSSNANSLTQAVPAQ
jgi:hypothetical protein